MLTALRTSSREGVIGVSGYGMRLGVGGRICGVVESFGRNDGYYTLNKCTIELYKVYWATEQGCPEKDLDLNELV